MIPRIDADDFARRFALRAANTMWLLGAGASAAAGIPTAGDMIWEFKQRLYVSQRRVEPQAVADLSNPAVRQRLQSHIDSSGTLPAAGAPDEYAALFEAVYAAEADRRAYIDSKMVGASPSYGHVALATLMHGGLTRLVWTTNFDPMLADAAARVYGSTGALSTVDLGAPIQARQLIEDERWPIEVKLHGDFRSRRLKNTTDELRHQDVQLRQVLVGCCRRYGLVVIGYSGRDDSVMEAVSEALDHEGSFPKGLFWLNRGDNVLPRVEALLERAEKSGVEAALVSVENFDEALRDLTRLISDIDTTTLDEFAFARRRWTGVPRPSGRKGWPVVRLNAVPIVEAPSVCRRIACEIGGFREIRAAVTDASVDLLFARVRAGVLAFGDDSDARKAFADFGIKEFDLHTIEVRRLRYDSGERGLLREAMVRAVNRSRGLRSVRRRSSDLLYPVDVSDAAWQPLAKLVGSLRGSVPGAPGLTWVEGISVQLDWADERLWLLVDPRTVFEGIDDSNRAIAADFARERSVKRYNRQLNDLIGFWASALAGSSEPISALGVLNGLDASFRLSPETAFSRRLVA